MSWSWEKHYNSAANANAGFSFDDLRRAYNAAANATGTESARDEGDRVVCERVCRWAARVGWRLRVVESGGFSFRSEWKLADGRISRGPLAHNKRSALVEACRQIWPTVKEAAR